MDPETIRLIRDLGGLFGFITSVVCLRRVKVGERSFRWGYWCAMTCVLLIMQQIYASAVVSEVAARHEAQGQAFSVAGALTEHAAFGILALTAIIGLFRKKRIGVKLLFITFGLAYAEYAIACLAGWLKAFPLLLAGVPIWFGINYVYFKKRWQDLS